MDGKGYHKSYYLEKLVVGRFQRHPTSGRRRWNSLSYFNDISGCLWLDKLTSLPLTATYIKEPGGTSSLVLVVSAQVHPCWYMSTSTYYLSLSVLSGWAIPWQHGELCTVPALHSAQSPHSLFNRHMKTSHNIFSWIQHSVTRTLNYQAKVILIDHWAVNCERTGAYWIQRSRDVWTKNEGEAEEDEYNDFVGKVYIYFIHVLDLSTV